MNRNDTLVEAFKWLFIGLFICGITAYGGSLYANKIYNSFNGIGWILFLIIELVLVVALSAFIKKISPTTAKILYLLYTAMTGLSLNGIFLVYKIGSIAYVFFITAVLFLIFAFIGKTTKIDLSKFGIYLLVGIIAIIILEIINIFIANNTLNMALCIATVIIFCGYTAYDINRLLNSSYLDDSPNQGIYYAFQLFLDFINIFIELLKIFGKERD